MTPETIYVLGQLQLTDNEKAALVACKLKGRTCFLRRRILGEKGKLDCILFSLNLKTAFNITDDFNEYYIRDFQAISEYIISHKIEFKPYVFPKSTLL